MFDTPTMEDGGLNIIDWDATIYRIYSVDRFKNLLRTNENGLVHPSKWDDPFENFFLKCIAVTSQGERVSLESLSNSWYGQCWTKNRDSDAMWRIYSPKKDGVRVTTTIRKLFESFYDSKDSFAKLKFFIGTVQYQEKAVIENFLKKTSFMDLAFGGQATNFAKTLCIKRPEFSHENEIRLLFYDAQTNTGLNKVAKFPLDLGKVFTEIALDPRMSPDEFAQIRAELIAHGCTVPITQSDLYQFDAKEIRLD